MTVADDGGSSGRLRESYGILPPGDIRNCLAALSNDEQMLTQLFRYRFSGSGGLDGHSFGNLFITALAEITGSFEEAIAESGRVLSVSGRVLPSTLHDVKLVADVQLPQCPKSSSGAGREQHPKNGGTGPPPVAGTERCARIPACSEGDPQCGYDRDWPGQLVHQPVAEPAGAGFARCTSMPAARSRSMSVILQPSQAKRILYSCYDHMRALEEHVGDSLFDIVLCNDNYEGQLNEDSQWVRADEKTLDDSRVHCADLSDESHPWRHDSSKLAAELDRDPG